MFRQELAENDRRSMGRREGFCGESCLFEKPLYELSCLRHSQVLSRYAGLLTEDSQFFYEPILVSVDVLRNLTLPCVDIAEGFSQGNPTLNRHRTALSMSRLNSCPGVLVAIGSLFVCPFIIADEGRFTVQQGTEY